MNGVVHVATTVPTLSSVMPTGGPTTGGTLVTLTGTNFAGGCGVTFGGTASASVNVTNSSTMTATTPYNVVVTNPDGQSATRNGFVVLAAAAIPALSRRALLMVIAALALAGAIALR